MFYLACLFRCYIWVFNCRGCLGDSFIRVERQSIMLKKNLVVTLIIQIVILLHRKTQKYLRRNSSAETLNTTIHFVNLSVKLDITWNVTLCFILFVNSMPGWCWEGRGGFRSLPLKHF